VEVLLLNGADVKSLDGGKRSALLSACWQGHLHIVDILLTAGADVNQQCCQVLPAQTLEIIEIILLKRQFHYMDQALVDMTLTSRQCFGSARIRNYLASRILPFFTPNVKICFKNVGTKK